MAVSDKLDEALSPMVSEPLREAGYSVFTVAEQGWAGWKDADLWPRVVAERVFFVTTDKGFGDIRRYPPGTHSGILLLRPDRESLLEYRALVKTFVDKHRIESLIGSTCVITAKGIRIRRKPPDARRES